MNDIKRTQSKEWLDLEFGRQDPMGTYAQRMMQRRKDAYMENSPYYRPLYLQFVYISGRAVRNSLMHTALYKLFNAVHIRPYGRFNYIDDKYIDVGSCDPRLGLVIGKNLAFTGPVESGYVQYYYESVKPKLVDENVPFIPGLFKMMRFMQATERHVKETTNRPIMRMSLIFFANCMEETCTDPEMGEFAKTFKASGYNLSGVDTSDQYTVVHPTAGSILGNCPPNRLASAWLRKLGVPERGTHVQRFKGLEKIRGKVIEGSMSNINEMPYDYLL